MARRNVIIPLISMSLSLCGCVFFSNGEWKKSYGTPELFLNQVSEHWCYIYTYDNRSELAPDSNLQVRDMMANSGPFEETALTSSKQERFFTYEIYISPATSGPNYCTMSLYDDGFIKIDYKSSLGPHQFAYFTMNEDKATSLIDLVFEKIPYEKKISEEDYEKAKEEGGIEAFLPAMKNRLNALCSCCEIKKDAEWRYHYFTDSGELLEVMESAAYALTDTTYSDSWAVVEYNRENVDSTALSWIYRLYDGYEVASIEYWYKDRVGRATELRLYYSLEESKGRSIFEKALEIAKK